MKNKQNILQLLISSINFIFISMYLVIIFLLSIYFDLFSIKTIFIILILLLLLLLLCYGIINLHKYNLIKNELHNIDEKFLNFFNKEHIRKNWIYIIYLVTILFSVVGIITRAQNGFIYVFIYIIIMVIFLLIRKRIIKMEYKGLNIKSISIMDEKYYKHQRIKQFIKYISVYIIITSILVILFCCLTNAWYSWFVICAITTIILILKFIINNPLFINYRYKKKMFSIKLYNSFVMLFMFVLLYISMIIGTYYLRWYIDITKEVTVKENKTIFEDNIYKIYMSNENYKILQLSDIHVGGSFITYRKDLKALDSIQKLVSNTKPDLIIITGDLVYPMPVQSFYLNNDTALYQLVLFFNYLNVPWTFVYGNHETEGYALKDAKDLYQQVIYGSSKMYDENNALLFYNYDENIFGRSNMIFEIINKDKSINQVLYLMDSGDYYSTNLNDYDYIKDDQVDWYKTTLNKIGISNSSMIFFHIPLIETKEAINKYYEGNSEIKYHFGEFNEEVACSQYRSKLFDEAVRLGSTKAMFYGHDHKNNISISYRGIQLTYGMSIDYLATPGIENMVSQRGATLITLHENSSYEVKQIKLSDIINN